jgi:hexokinase
MRLETEEITKIRKDTGRFLRHYGMHHEDIDIKKHVLFFLDDMKRGLEGKKSSLKMLPTFINVKEKLPVNKDVLVLDAGGTNFRSAILCFDDNSEPVITGFNKTFMPGSKGEIKKSDFFKVIFENIRDSYEKSETIGFVFSYPIEIFPNRDGRLIRFTKEIQAPEVEGQFIGKNLLDEAKRNGFDSEKEIVLLNDSVASLLAGVSAFQKRQFEGYVGFILGTGMNCCYIEKNENIKKGATKELDQSEYQIINMEAGNFSRGPISEIDECFDEKTQDPGAYTFEKMLSGAYLGGLATEVIRFAIKDGLVSKQISEDLPKDYSFRSRDIDDFLLFPPEDASLRKLLKNFSQKDLLATFFLFENLLERAAKIVSIILSSSVIKSQKGLDPRHPMCITAEGSSFYNMKNFKSRVDRYTRSVLKKAGPYNFEIHRVDNAIVLGGAAAGLSS